MQKDMYNNTWNKIKYAYKLLNMSTTYIEYNNYTCELVK